MLLSFRIMKIDSPSHESVLFNSEEEKSEINFIQRSADCALDDYLSTRAETS